MRRVLTLGSPAAPALAALVCALLAAPSPGLAARVHTAATAAPSQPQTSAAPAPPASTPPPAPAAPTLRLVVQHAGGHPAFAIVGAHILLRGFLAPYVAGEKVKVSFYRDGRRLAVRLFGLAPRANGSGEFHVSFVSHDAGLVQARAVHYASPALPLLAAQSEKVRFTHTDLAEGSRGASVRLLQSELSTLHYSVPVNGVFEEATGRAVIAFRKIAGMERVPYASRGVFAALERGEGSFHVRYPRDGRHVEADLTRRGWLPWLSAMGTNVAIAALVAIMIALVGVVPFLLVHLPVFRSHRWRHGRRYRVFPGGLANVCEVDERGRPRLGLCFRTLGELPIGDVMLSQKIALESCEVSVLAVARRFELNAFMFRRSRLLG